MTDSANICPSEGPPRFVVPYYVRALALAIPAIMLGLQIAGWIGFVPVIKNGHFDFRAYYSAGLMVRTGQISNLYDYGTQKRVQDQTFHAEGVALPFTHPAYEALFYVPLSL